MKKGVLLGLNVIALSNLKRLLQGVLNLLIKPAFNAARDETARHKKKNNGRNKGQPDKRNNQFCPEFRADDTALSVEIELDKIPQNKNNQDDQGDDIDIHESENQDIASRRGLGL